MLACLAFLMSTGAFADLEIPYKASKISRFAESGVHLKLVSLEGSDGQIPVYRVQLLRNGAVVANYGMVPGTNRIIGDRPFAGFVFFISNPRVRAPFKVVGIRSYDGYF